MRFRCKKLDFEKVLDTVKKKFDLKLKFNII